MSFVPLSGPAVLHGGEPARDGMIEFTDGRRTMALPVKAAIPVLSKARTHDDVHPSVGLLSAAALLGLQLVAGGRFEPSPDLRGWVWVERPEDVDRVRRLAEARAYDDVSPQLAEEVVRSMVAAVVDAMPASRPRAAREPAGGPRAGAVRRGVQGRDGRPSRHTQADADFVARLQQRLERHRTEVPTDLPTRVRLSLRIEADEEELVGGSVRAVLQVHDEDNPLHLCDAGVLWTGTAAQHGFADDARTAAAVALRGAAEAWPVLQRLEDLRVPDEITLDSDELVSLLDEGVAALGAVDVEVLWPRSLGHDLTATPVLTQRTPAAGGRAGGAAGGPQEDLLNTSLFGPEQLFAFEWQVALHGEPLTELELKELTSATTPLLRLRGQWTVVSPAVAKKARKRLLRSVAPGEALAAGLTGMAEVAGEGTEQQVIVGASIGRWRDRVQAAGHGEPLREPPGLAAELRDYQRRGLTWLHDLTSLGLGGCLADDMGLGKTITLIALHLQRAAVAAQGGVPATAGPTLVVCPASLLGNWQAEIERFAPGIPVRRFHGTSRDVADLVAPTAGIDPGFVLTTYGTMRSAAETLAQVAWGLVVADEAQHIKNARSATARALRTLPAQARVALTGTPVENDLTELWAILDWTVPGLLGSRNAFRRVWAAPIESGRHQDKARHFADLIAPFLLRRRKSDPGIAPELPPKTETDHLLRLTREQTVLYEAFVADTMERIERVAPDDHVARAGLVLALLTGLKQICNHPAHFLKQGGGRIAGRSQKIDLLDEVVETVVAEGGAVLVFTQYVAMARLLERHWSALQVPHQFLHGGTPVAERERMVAAFQAGDVPVFLLSLKAGGTGLNLTRADHVVHVDRWWNPAVEDQATDRAYRIGQTKPVQVHRLVTRGTIEARIAELLSRKRALADAVLGRGEAALTELSDDELRDLVTLRPAEALEDLA